MPKSETFVEYSDILIFHFFTRYHILNYLSQKRVKNEFINQLLMNRPYFYLYFTLNASWTWIPASVYPSCRWLNVLGNVRTMFLDIKWSRASLFSWSFKRWLSHNSWSQSISDPYMWPILYGSYRQDHIVYSPNNMDYKRTESPTYQNLYSILSTVPSWYSHHTREYFHFSLQDLG